MVTQTRACSALHHSALVHIAMVQFTGLSTFFTAVAGCAALYLGVSSSLNNSTILQFSRHLLAPNPIKKITMFMHHATAPRDIL